MSIKYTEFFRSKQTTIEIFRLKIYLHHLATLIHRRKPLSSYADAFLRIIKALRNFVDIQMTDRQNVDIQIVDTKIYIDIAF
jgi:hypothetical protein